MEDALALGKLVLLHIAVSILAISTGWSHVLHTFTT